MECCVTTWQARLGLVEIYDGWRAKARRGTLRRRVNDDHDWPPLNSTMLTSASARRFSVTQTSWARPRNRHSRPTPALDMITDVSPRNWYYAELWESHLDAATLKLLHGRSDLSIVQLRDMEPFQKDAYSALAKTRTGGARVFHTNPPSPDNAFRGRQTFPFYAYGAATAHAAFHKPPPIKRSKLLECCCFGDRVFRFERRRALLNATGLCGGAAAALGADATLGRYRRAKFVFWPRGEGCSNYREFEALYAGAIPVVDVDPGAGRSEFWANMPHVPAVYPRHFRKWTRVCAGRDRRCLEPNRAAGDELVAATLRDVTPATLRRVEAAVKARGRSASICARRSGLTGCTN